MDRPVTNPVHPAVRRFRRLARTGGVLLAIVFGVAAIPPAFLYVASRMGSENAASSLFGESSSGNSFAAVPESPVVAFERVTVISMTRNETLPDHTVLVQNGRITSILPAGSSRVPANALRIDGRGKFLLPGLADLHIHLRAHNPELAQQLLDLFVARGVTTVLNLYGTDRHLQIRSQISSGKQFGPTFFTSGPYISDAPDWEPSPKQAEDMVVEHKRAGYDFIKTHGNFSREALHRLMETSRREKIRVIGHAPRNLGMSAAFEERMDAMAHAEEYLSAGFFFGVTQFPAPGDVEGRRKFAAERAALAPQLAADTAKAGAWVIANLSAYHMIWRQVADIDAVLARPEVQYVPRQISREWQPSENTYVRRFPRERAGNFESSYGLLEKLVKAMNDSGVKLLAGTDTPIPSVVPGFSIHDELGLMVAAGLSPFDALRTATVNAAEFLREGKEAGTIEPGRRADLILLDANPLADISNTKKISGVMLRGRWLSGKLLEQRLAELAAANTTAAAQ